VKRGVTFRLANMTTSGKLLLNFIFYIQREWYSPTQVIHQRLVQSGQCAFNSSCTAKWRICMEMFWFSSSCVPYVASFSALSIFDCHFGIL